MLKAFRRVLTERAGLAGVEVPEDHLEPLARYFELLERWNRSINLTSLPLSDVSVSAVDRLFVEPLQAATLVRTAPAGWFDLGSGGGSPAVPMRVAMGGGGLRMVESRSRKAAFLREVVRELELRDVEVLETRIEALRSRPGMSRSADLITVRAVRVENAIEESIADLASVGGLLLWFSNSDTAKTMPAGFLPARTMPLPEGRSVRPFVRLP